MSANDLLAQLKGQLIVSCQPVRNGVFDNPEAVKSFIRAASTYGAGGIRVEGTRDCRAARSITDLPIIGLIKKQVQDTDVFITPTQHDIDELVQTGVEVVAVDATRRSRPVAVEDLINHIHAHNLFSMADVSTFEEGILAAEAGATFVATTLSGYTDYSRQAKGPDLELVQALSGHGVRVVAEGNIATPEQAVSALHRGAFAVTVGTAITRPEWIVQSFVKQMHDAA